MLPHQKSQQLSPITEMARTVVAGWPFGRGTSRIASLMGALLFYSRKDGVIGRTGYGGTLSPWQADEFRHPTFWHLYEKPVRRQMRRLLSPGDIYVDVGAHRGWLAGFGLSLVSPGGMVVACEPFPLHAERLRELASLNPNQKLVIENVAVSSASGTATLLATDEREGTVHTIIPAFASEVQEERRPIEVATSTLDEITERHSVFRANGQARGVVIKIDAEGAELDILQGARQTLAQPSLRALIIEVIGSCGGGFTERSRESIDLLRGAGFKITVLTQKVGARRIDQRGRELKDSDLDSELNVLALRDPEARLH